MSSSDQLDATLDNNGEAKMELSWSKSVKDYRLRNFYAPRTHEFRNKIHDRVIAHASSRSTTCAQRVRQYWLLF